VVRKAARHGQVEAQYRFGFALLNGQGVVQDYKSAFYWLEKAAQQGNAKAQFNLGDMYYSGTSINKDIPQAYLEFAQKLRSQEFK
jgi:FOG: TPR repeat, SEL1 subfamily